MKTQIVFIVCFAFFLAVSADESEPSTSNTSGTTVRACEPNTEFTKDCSVCKCNADGTELTCEKKDCPVTESSTTESTQVETCTPGENFKVKCNECRCPESGKRGEAACTVIGCPDE